MNKMARDNVDRQYQVPPLGLSISTAPLLSPTMTYTGPPPSYSSTIAATPTNLAALEYLSPPCSRRTTVDDKTCGPPQSLPSIQEALGDSAVSFSAPDSGHPLSAASRIGHLPPSCGVQQSFPEAPSGPPNPFAQSSAGAQVPDENSHPSHLIQLPGFSTNLGSDKSTFPAPKATKPPPPSLYPLDTKSVSTATTRPNLPCSYHPSPHPNNYCSSSAASPSHFPPYKSSYAYSADPSTSPSSNFPSAPDHSRFDSSFKAEDGKQPGPRSHTVQPYSDSVKRHLDIFDIEMALNDVTDGSTRALEFARTWSYPTHQRQRNGQLPEGLPSLLEVDDLMRQSGKVSDAFSRIREAIVVQEHALAEEQARALQQELSDGEPIGYPTEVRDSGSFPEGDSKKRRGKVAPPGRCHSCNRAETPEWRRGPDGARTLCNACGLHYAKLTRKMAVNKNAALSSSSLRPKISEAQSTM